MSTRIGIVISSVRPTRVGPAVARWVAEQAPEGVDVEIIDLAEVDLPFLPEPKLPAEGDYQEESTKAWSERVRGFDGLVLTVAEYNGGYTASLKNAIDTLFAEWNDLPIGLVGYGFGGGARAMKALEPVLETVKAVRVDGPNLRFNEEISMSGEALESAPADAVREVFEQVVAKVPARV